MNSKDPLHTIEQQLAQGNWQELVAYLRDPFARPDSPAFTPSEQAQFQKICELADKLKSFSGSAAEREILESQLIELLRDFLVHLQNRSIQNQPKPKPRPKGNIFTRMLAPFSNLFNKMQKAPPMALPFPKESAIDDVKHSLPDETVEKMGHEEELLEQMSGAEPPEESFAMPAPEADAQPESNPLSVQEQGMDIVNVSVYAPETVIRSRRFLISAFAHLFEQREEVNRMAREADPQAVQQGSKTLNMSIRRGESLRFSLELEGWNIDEPVQQITWFGVPGSVEYIVEVPTDYADDIAMGILIVSNDTGPVGRVKFNLSLTGEGTADAGHFAATDSRTYQRAYLSYADEDLAAVSQETQSYRNQSSFVFTQPFPTQDADWEEKTIKAISESDLFVLFWSKAATRSLRVTTEWESALGLRYGRSERLPDLLPVSLESPLPDPPQELAFLNFIDHFAPLAAPVTVGEAGSFPANSPAMLKARCEEMIANGDFAVFDLLAQHFAQDTSKQEELILLRMQWSTLKRKERLRLITSGEGQLDQNKIVFGLLAIVGEI